MITKAPLIISLKNQLDKGLKSAGVEKDPVFYLKRVIFASLFFGLITLLFLKDNFTDLSGVHLLLSIISYFVLICIGYAAIFGFSLFGWINLKIYNRKKKLEMILADYLQLVAANVGAGMPIDQAMWYAVRERFGVLAKEIETVAKKVMSGQELSDALKEFAVKYDSDVLTQTITLLIEGLETGGEIANLIADIAWNIRESQIMKEEISADIMSYVIFISFASLIAAPLLFGLSLKLITIMSTVMGGIDISGTAGVSSVFSFSGAAGLIRPSDFKIFAFVCLGTTSLFSALILSAIRSGSLKDSIKYVPLFIAITYGLFLIISAVLDLAFGSLIQMV